jgi:hypothetical protein
MRLSYVDLLAVQDTRSVVERCGRFSSRRFTLQRDCRERELTTTLMRGLTALPNIHSEHKQITIFHATNWNIGF